MKKEKQRLCWISYLCVSQTNVKTMEEELNYVTVTFKSRNKSNDQEVIYDEVKTEQACDTQPVLQDNEKKALQYTQLHLATAGLGIVCVVLVSVVIALSIHLKTVMSEHSRENMTLTAQNLLLTKEKAELERDTQELTRERDQLNWTIGVILKYDRFPVNTRCPQKVCRPCEDGWELFQSHCYLILKSDYWSHWRTWEGSRENCRQKKADLLVIESRDEQEFITNHTEVYQDEKHGYWIGLRKNDMDTWMWADGSNITATYWIEKEHGSRASCVLSLPRTDPQASWKTAGCEMTNRYICKTRALIKAD